MSRDHVSSWLARVPDAAPAARASGSQAHDGGGDGSGDGRGSPLPGMLPLFNASLTNVWQRLSGRPGDVRTLSAMRAQLALARERRSANSAAALVGRGALTQVMNDASVRIKAGALYKSAYSTQQELETSIQRVMTSDALIAGKGRKGGGAGVRLLAAASRYRGDAAEGARRLWHRVNLGRQIDEWVPVTSPDARYRVRWEMVILLLVLYTAIVVPLEVTYGLPSYEGLQAVDWAITALFAADMLVCFRTGFFDEVSE